MPPSASMRLTVMSAPLLGALDVLLYSNLKHHDVEHLPASFIV